MSNLRKKYASTSVDELKKARDAEDSAIDKGGSRSEFLKFVNGVNKFRIYPKHEGENLFYKMRSVHWITIEKDGKERRRNVCNGRMHGGLKKDIIEAYIEFVQMKLGASSDSDDQEKVKKLTGEKTGMQMKTTWICYAEKHMPDGKEFGLLEMKKTVRDAIMDLNIIEDADEAYTSDVFTDIEEGRLALITYDSNAKKATDYYKTAVSKKVVPLTDEDLETFDAVTPLSKLEMFNYSRKDFQLALEGLQYFDNLHDINIFDDEDFQAIVEGISKTVGGSNDEPKAKAKAKPQDEESEEEDEVQPAPKPKAKAKPQPEEEEEEEEEAPAPKAKAKKTDKFDEMDRNELKVFKAENEITDFKVTTNLSDDEIRVALRKWEASQEEEAEVTEEEEEEEEAPKPKVSSNLANIKAKMGLKK